MYRPQPALRPYVREMLLVRSASPRTQVLLPETTFTMALQLSGSTSLGMKPESTVVSGLQRGARLAEHSADATMLIVRFTETGAANLLNLRADELYEQVEHLDSLVRASEIECLRNRIADTRDDQRALQHVEEFLFRRIPEKCRVTPQVEAAAKVLRDSGGQISIESLAKHTAMSLSSLERRFRAEVGATPKHLARLARLQHVCTLWERGLNLTQIAHEAGYSDQPHFTHDFRALTGMSPEELFRSSTPRNLPTFYK